MNWKQIYSILKNFFLIFSLLFCVTFSVLFIIEEEIRTARFEELLTNEERIIQLEYDFLTKEFNALIADLNYLRNAFGLQLEYSENYDEVASNWVIYSTQRKQYDQIRFIDAEGEEKIRINFNDNSASIVPDDELQNKSNRYYFKEAISLNNHEVYISPLDLNIEHSEIEYPLKPMIRIATPIYNSQGEQIGVLLLNYLAEGMLSDFRELAENSLGDIVLLNTQSYWLSNEDPSYEWNFMFEDRQDIVFSDQFDNEWDEITKNNAQFITPNGLFTSKIFDLSQAILPSTSTNQNQTTATGNESWYIVSVLSRNASNQNLFLDDPKALFVDILRRNVFSLLLIFVLSGILVSYLYLRKRNFERIKYFSEYDWQTNVFNRRAGLLKLNHLFPTDDRRQFQASLCFIDINGLKKVNDVFGHKAGDELIVSIVETIKSSIREKDFITRLGGDEFLITFVNTDVITAEFIWDRIKLSFESINQKNIHPFLLSASHGIVSLSNYEKYQIEGLIKLADEKMYEEKREMAENLQVIR